MLRSTCAVLAFVAFLIPAPPDVDAVVFAKAFRAGQADRYNNRQVSGAGVSFHGPIKERVADGSTRLSLVVALGAIAPDGQLRPIRTWEEFVAAERARTTLAVALSGPDLPSVPAEPTALTFSGVFDGQVRTIMHPPQAAGSSDTGPCPGEGPRTSASESSFQCAPLLTGATATIARR